MIFDLTYVLGASMVLVGLYGPIYRWMKDEFAHDGPTRRWGPLVLAVLGGVFWPITLVLIGVDQILKWVERHAQ